MPDCSGWVVGLTHLMSCPTPSATLLLNWTVKYSQLSSSTTHNPQWHSKTRHCFYFTTFTRHLLNPPNGLPLFTPLLPLSLGYFNKIKEAKWNYGESPIYIRKIIFLFKPPLDIRFCAKMLFAGVDGALNFFVMEFHFVSLYHCMHLSTPGHRIVMAFVQRDRQQRQFFHNPFSVFPNPPVGDLIPE